MAIERELLDRLLAGRDPNEAFAGDGPVDEWKKALSERILNAEFDEHLDGERSDGNANRRNARAKKPVLTVPARPIDRGREVPGKQIGDLVQRNVERCREFLKSLVAERSLYLVGRQLSSVMSAPGAFLATLSAQLFAFRLSG